ncbi:MAG: RNA polymerase sigma factor [Acidobacteriota bacterium]
MISNTETAVLSPTLLSLEDRLTDLFDTHHQRLYRLARRMSGNAEEAYDLVQECFLRAARHAHRLPASASGAEAWLVRTLVNLCRDGFRRAEVRKRAGDAETQEMIQQTLHDASSTSGSDVETRRVHRQAVRSALSTLDPRRRAIVILRELEDRPMREVARMLSITPVTARWHLAKARRQLAQLLQDPISEHPP